MNQPSPPPPPTTQAGPLRLYRHPRGKLGGVAAGLGGYFDIDPVIARLLFVIAAFSGLGIPAYLLCWIVVPKAETWPPAGYRGSPIAHAPPHRRQSLAPGLIALLLAALVSAGTDGLGKLVLPAALVGFGVFLLTRPPQLSEPRETDKATGLPEDEQDDIDWGADSTTFESEEADEAQDQKRKLGRFSPAALRHRITPVVLSVLAFGLALCLLGAHFDWFHVSVLSYSLAALAVVVGGLVASRYWRSAPGLLPLAGAISVVALGSLGARHASEQLDLHKALSDHGENKGGVGTHRYAPSSLSELAPTYSLGMGELVLDLQNVDFGREHRHVSLQLGLGDMEVIVPPDLEVVLQGSVGVGEPLSIEAPKGPVRPGSQLIVEMHLGIGEGRVVRGERSARLLSPPTPPTPWKAPSAPAQSPAAPL